MLTMTKSLVVATLLSSLASGAPSSSSLWSSAPLQIHLDAAEPAGIYINSAVPGSHHDHEHGRRKFNPLEHMSGIAPYHDQRRNADLTPPKGCRVSAAAWLIRHSCIAANSDDWEDYMRPFAEKVEAAHDALQGLDDDSPLAFLKSWKSPVAEDMVSQITQPGRDDAFAAGKNIRKLYPDLLPPKDFGKAKKKKDKMGEPFKVWTASSERDVETAKAWIKGAFPRWQEGEDGEGDGEILQLVKVKNSDPNWGTSLTPHKICPAFSKERGQMQSRLWLETYGYPALHRLNKMAKGLITFGILDVAAAFAWCGYESVTLASRNSSFCSTDLFTEHEFHAFGYSQDLKYWHQVGYGAPYAPYLGVGWLNTSSHLLMEAFTPPHPHLRSAGKLPNPEHPPEASHKQLFHAYFTHREETPVVLTALGIWNQSEPSPYKLDHARKWKTSHVLPFGGHVALERLTCEDQGHEYIRVVVNGAQEKLDSCQDGPQATCPMDKFGEFVKERLRLYGDFEKGCKA